MSEELNDIDPKELDELSKFIETLRNESDVDYDLIMENFGLNVHELEREMDDYIPQVDVEYVKSTDEAINPKYAYPTDSGFDLHSIEEMYVEPFDRVLIPTGLHFSIPDGYEIQIRSKSGLALKQGLMVLNSPGTVDQGYTGEIKVIIFNTSKRTIKIEKSQKIAQAVLCPVVNGKWVNLVKVEKIGEKDRNDKGFGSTGL